MSDFSPVAKLGELEHGQKKAVEMLGRKLVIVNVNGEHFAMNDTCVHRGAQLSDGPLENQYLSCPWHNWVFDVTTGACLTQPDQRALCYKVKVEGDEVLVSLDLA
jgi:nitrite reductase (NADH) small subunit